MQNGIRRGLTLIELLVVLAITGVLVALLMASVMRVREAALRAESQNNLRQIVLAVQNYTSAHQGRLPSVGGFSRIVGHTVYPAEPTGPPLFMAIFPYIGQVSRQRELRPVPLYLSPADPTAAEAAVKGLAVSSYAANAQVFHDKPRLPSVFSDGSSNTIAFAEHYAHDCGGASFYYWWNGLSWFHRHRPAFADETHVVPETQGNPPVTRPQPPGHTFQAAPSRRRCWAMVAQTPHSAGMLVAMGDGSVRILAVGMSETTYWAAVTPAGGETLGTDWWP